MSLLQCLALCSNLSRLYTVSATPKILNRCIYKLTELRLHMFSPREIDVIASRGNKLVKLCLPSATISLYQMRELAENLGKLRHITFKSELKNIRFLRCLKNLQEVVWYQASEEDDTDEKRAAIQSSLEEFMFTNGRRLKQFTLNINSKVRPDFLSRVHELCPNLEKLRLNLKGSKDIKVNSFPIHTMKRLKILSLCYLQLTNDNAVAILKGCPKLREVYLDYCSNLTPEVMEKFVE